MWNQQLQSNSSLNFNDKLIKLVSFEHWFQDSQWWCWFSCVKRKSTQRASWRTDRKENEGNEHFFVQNINWKLVSFRTNWKHKERTDEFHWMITYLLRREMKIVNFTLNNESISFQYLTGFNSQPLYVQRVNQTWPYLCTWNEFLLCPSEDSFPKCEVTLDCNY